MNAKYQIGSVADNTMTRFVSVTFLFVQNCSLVSGKRILCAEWETKF